MQSVLTEEQEAVHSTSAIAMRIRLWSGLVLMAYLVTHLANQALGLISLETMETGRVWFVALWRNPAGTAALYGALLIHAVLSLWTVYQRHHFRLPIWEVLQILLGLAIPPLLASHVVGTRLASELFGFKDSYQTVVLYFWVASALAGAKQALVVCIAWLHGCLGFHFWLRSKPWYTRFTYILLCGALLLPVLSLLGFSQAGREVSRSAQQPGWVQQTFEQAKALSGADSETSARLVDGILYGYAGVLALTLAAWAIRRLHDNRGTKISISYVGGKSVLVPEGYSVLEASRRAGIPHASMCGGKGKCTTCRVSVHQGREFLPPASIKEKTILEFIDAPPNVRLACQLRPIHDLSVAPLVPVTPKTTYARPSHVCLTGLEQNVVVMFADLRGFTTIAEHKLPYDVVFLLNRYFEVVGHAIEVAGGTINQFTGDGVMALFGTETSPQKACRQALEAVCEMTEGLAELSADLAEDLAEPLRIGIGIHMGQAVVGNMGRGIAMNLTAVGDTVHVASRLQDLTKKYGCQLIMSNLVAENAGIDVSSFPKHELTVRNRRTPIVIRTVKDIQQLDYCLYGDGRKE